MKVLFDHQIFNYVFGGASKYFSMLLANMSPDLWETTSLFSSNEYVKSLGLFKTYPYRFRGQAILADYLNRPYTNMVMRRQNFDVYHQTNFGTFCFAALGNKPMVTTYHDSNLSTIDPHPEIVERQRKSLDRAQAIIAVSANTQKDLLELFPGHEKKVRVIYHGIEMPDMSLLPHQRLVERPYILYVGRRTEYKNFKLFIQAFSLLSQKEDVCLVCTSERFTAEEMEMFAKLGISDKVIHIKANEVMMKQLYRDAITFVFPSLYEGFGMPILEAWSCHCPVILSDCSCFPEIAGNAALYFNAKSIEECCNCMMHLISDNQQRDELIRLGDQRVVQFSWERCTQAHLEIYKELMD
uniref:Glycosyltransferase family 4 protein n=5 Tax=unclassified Prevotella TaxID=2638335 RepID=A0AB33JF64_9BACT